jgi:hypothetical protein
MSHVVQYLLVEADSVEEALGEVESKLENNPAWSDWHYANGSSSGSFAGRWEGVAFKNHSEDPDPVGVEKDVLRYSDNPDLADKFIQRAVEWRLEALASFKDKILANAYDIVDAVHDPFEKDVYGMNNYYYRKLADVLDNTWTSDTAVYDLHQWTASLSDWKDRIVLAPEKQFIVAVDFHH